MATKTVSRIKKAASKAKRAAKKATKNGKKVVAKVAQPQSAATKKPSRGRKKVTAIAKTEKKKATGTVDSVRGKAKKLVARVQDAEHRAADFATRIGSTIGGAILSIVKPSKARTGNKA